MTDKQIPLQKHLNIVSDLKLKLDEARCERDEALAREAEWMMRYKSTMIVDQRGYDRAIDEAAAVAEHYEPRCDICPSGVTNAIRSLKEKP